MHDSMTYQDALAFVQRVADKHGWVLNPEDDFLRSIVEGLLENLHRLGYYQCPCRLSYDERARDGDIICPCEYAAADIAEYGHCYCSLYLSQAFAASGREPQSIPERRKANRFPA